MFWASKARVAALEADVDRLRAEWLDAESRLEELHRRSLNTIRSLRRLADAREEEPEGETGPATFDDLERARRRYGTT